MGCCCGSKKTKKAFSEPLIVSEDEVDEIQIRCVIRNKKAKIFSVLAVYTKDCLEDTSLSKLAENINTCMEEMNDAFVNSAVGVQGRLVAIEPVEALNWQPTDNYRDALLKKNPPYTQVSELRKTHKAHVVLLVNSPNGGGNPMGGALPATTRDQAFVVVPFDKLLDEYTPAHEIGHLFGCEHDAGGYGLHPEPQKDKSCYGHVTEHWRTIMAYPQCKDKKPWGPLVIKHFSNPDVMYKGTATGTVQANNAAQIEKYADTILSLCD